MIAEKLCGLQIVIVFVHVILIVRVNSRTLSMQGVFIVISISYQLLAWPQLNQYSGTLPVHNLWRGVFMGGHRILISI
jgi:hypothetical protein